MLAVGMGYIYIDKFQTRRENREAYREAFLRYEAYPKARILTHDITYIPEGENFSAVSRMTVVNQKAKSMERLLLFLNPGLKISKLEEGGRKVPFQRERQVVVIERPLAPGDSVVFEMEYGGYIDEDMTRNILLPSGNWSRWNDTGNGPHSCQAITRCLYRRYCGTRQQWVR